MRDGAGASLRRIVAVALLSAAVPMMAVAAPNLGRPAMPEEVARWDLSVFPDGQGLPQGRGSVADGAAIYREHCVSCHGAGGRGASAEELAGASHRLTDPSPDKTIGSYWPYATTLFDYVRRSMPLNAPASLDDNQVYAVTAYLLHLNGILPEGSEIGRDSLPRVVMPNRQGFIAVDGGR
jgi:cytochrome c